MRKKIERKLGNKMSIVGIIALCFILTAIIWFYVRANTGYEVYVYYFNVRDHQLVPERRIIQESSQEEMLQAVIRLLYTNPRDVNLRQTIPEDLLFDDLIYVIGGVMHASFSVNYHQMAAYEEALFRASLVRTMTALPFIDSVKVLVDGEELVDSFGQVIGAESRDTVIVGETIRPRRVFPTTLRLYFVNEAQNGLVYELRTIERPYGVPIEHAVLQQLKEGPQSYGLISAIPSDTRILDIRTMEGICSINLSDEFINNFGGTMELAELTLQSIVHSIMENQSGVSSIQFLIESERVVNFIGVPYFDTLFERES